MCPECGGEMIEYTDEEKGKITDVYWVCHDCGYEEGMIFSFSQQQEDKS